MYVYSMHKEQSLYEISLYNPMANKEPSEFVSIKRIPSILEPRTRLRDD
jgi:hypothetical protein